MHHHPPILMPPFPTADEVRVRKARVAAALLIDSARTPDPTAITRVAQAIAASVGRTNWDVEQHNDGWRTMAAAALRAAASAPSTT